MNPKPETGEGEIVVRGPIVMKGYYKDPERTAEVLEPDGWFHTGDLGIFDETGRLYIKGRVKNMILGPSGENIYPEAIESIINSFEFVEDSLVFQDGGEILARIHLNYEAMKEHMQNLADSAAGVPREVGELMTELRRNVNNRLSSFSRIGKVIEQKEPFEKTPTKKIKRFLYDKLPAAARRAGTALRKIGNPGNPADGIASFGFLNALQGGGQTGVLYTSGQIRFDKQIPGTDGRDGHQQDIRSRLEGQKGQGVRPIVGGHRPHAQRVGKDQPLVAELSAEKIGGNGLRESRRSLFSVETRYGYMTEHDSADIDFHRLFERAKLAPGNKFRRRSQECSSVVGVSRRGPVAREMLGHGHDPSLFEGAGEGRRHAGDQFR